MFAACFCLAIYCTAKSCLEGHNACCGVADAPVSSARVRVAAATALGAAAVKAKMLADAEEQEIQRQVQVAVDAQIQKVQLKLNSMNQLEDALEKERSIMEVCSSCPSSVQLLGLYNSRHNCSRGQSLKSDTTCCLASSWQADMLKW